MKYLKLFENFDYDPIELPEEDYLYVQPSQIPMVTDIGKGANTEQIK